ncbi:MAG: sulfate reduction electron transfer complex DsrMKJOP subunit DsrM [Desulfobacterales bacterium]|nr:sulfate reduction electron transfer complex DsrMKJOP subunit DsrM [Desulfobacterales bacterium]
MNVNYLVSLVVVVALSFVPYFGIDAGLKMLFGIVIPYLAFAVFFVGVINRIVSWSRSPVPFRIPTTCGQQKSLPWFKQAKIDNPSTTVGVIARMALEIFLFRSLFRNTKMQLHKSENGPKITFQWELWLWLAALVFHYSFFVVLTRHLRFFAEPVPFFVQLLEKIDGIFQVGVPGVLISGFMLLLAATYLLVRRVIIPQVKYVSLVADYFPLFLIMGIAFTGIYMRYFEKVDIVGVKALTMGIITLSPQIPAGISTIFYVHLFLVSLLVAYIPFSKLMHMGGIFMSPTRNMANNNRATRHINPWNYPVKVHSYAEYEDDFREKMIEAGLPVEKE